MESRYDNYQSGGGEQSETEAREEIIFTPYSTIEAEIGSAFGTDSEYGNSLGVIFEDVEIIDGCLYFDPDKAKFKLFSWQHANDMTPLERHERGEEPSAEDASEFIRKTYAGNEKEYELVGARVPEVTDEDGEVIIEASSRVRDVDVGSNADDHEYGDFEDLGGDVIPFDNLISWYEGSSDYGPSVSAQTLAETLTQYGDDAVQDEDDIYNWLVDTTGNNILREDLEDRRVEFFTVTESGEDYTYNMPIVVDVETGQRIQPDNRGNVSDDVQEAEEEDAGTYPEPIADYLQSGDQLDLDEDRARNILNDLIDDDSNAMTADMVEDNGGKDTLVDKVT